MTPSRSLSARPAPLVTPCELVGTVVTATMVSMLRSEAEGCYASDQPLAVKGAMIDVERACARGLGGPIKREGLPP